MENDKINKYLSEISSEDYSSSVYEMENWIRKESVENSFEKERNKSVLIKTLKENKLKYAVVFASLLILFFAGKIPVSQNKSIGNLLVWAVDKESKDDVGKIDEFNWINRANLIVKDTMIDNREMLYYTMIFPPEFDKSEIESYKNELAVLNYLKDLKIVPVFEPVKRPVYSAALFKLFNIDLTKIEINTDDIINNVNLQLAKSGVDDDIEINFNPDKYNDIMISPKLSSDSLRLKIHNDIVKEFYSGKAVLNIKKSLDKYNIALNAADSVIKKIVINFDNKTLKKMSYPQDVNEFNVIVDSIITKIDNQKLKKLNAKLKILQDSVLSKIGKELNIKIDIPDIGKIYDSVKKDFDFEKLKKMKINISREGNILDLENLDKEIEEKIDENDIDIDIDLDGVKGYDKKTDSLNINKKSKRK
jgi:hypothetical protein